TLFLLFLPIFIGHIRALEKNTSSPRWAYGLVLGLALDSAIHGVTGTLDLSWIPGLLTLFVVAATSGFVVWLLWLEPFPHSEAPPGVSWGEALPLLALGPYLLIQALIFQNQGWISEVGGLSPSSAFIVLMLGNLLSVAGLTWGFACPHKFNPLLALVAAIYLVFATATADQSGTIFIISMLIGQLLMGWGWAQIGKTLAPASRPGLGRTTVVLGLSMILFLLLAFIYYISLDIAIPIPRTAIPPAGAVIFGIAILYASIRVRRLSLPSLRDTTTLILVMALTAISLLYWIATEAFPRVEDEVTPSLPVRVMTYNIHSAFASDGRQDPEAIARVIEASGADIIALQEVSRGWLINGSTDLMAWFARRLGMQVLFQGTTGPMWGNAILTRYPILEHGSGSLPLAGTIMGRGYLWAKIDVGAQDPLLIIATHLHHVEAENEVRLVQVPVFMAFWDEVPYSLILGDMNSEPGYPEMDLIAQAGLVDSWAEAGSGKGHSWPAIDPFERIDWIWHTPDLAASEAEIIQSTASDHLPLVVTLDMVH
ncbi:MAG: endonuclease/exonuclease/phosphatase family protein, partial [Anaerolineales bacterium]|nr:endonuclease/exonuclease/phosphatase family protein [Anaerolineales bacterium]